MGAKMRLAPAVLAGVAITGTGVPTLSAAMDHCDDGHRVAVCPAPIPESVHTHESSEHNQLHHVPVAAASAGIVVVDDDLWMTPQWTPEIFLAQPLRDDAALVASSRA